MIHSSALGVSADKDDVLTENEYIQKKQMIEASKVTNPWLIGIFFFEIYVFGSVRVAHFFTHSREAPSLEDI